MPQWCPIVRVGHHPPRDHVEPAFEARELAAVVAGELVRAGTRPIRGGAVDSRRVTSGNGFFALPGERTDGQRFLPQAVTAGAAALIVRDVPAGPELDALLGRGGDVTVIAVPDAGEALRRAAAAWRARWDPLCVGVTGSLAKTSTKEQVAEVLAERWTVLRNEGNENNEIGLPLTLLREGPEHDALVLEMGLYQPGDIALLAALARPTIGVVTAVRGVHLSRAGTLEAIEAGKRELVDALPAGGTAVLNADDPLVSRWAVPAGVARLSYGFADDADVRATRVTSQGAAGMGFTLHLRGDAHPAMTAALGRHSVHNALAAAAVGVAAGLDTGSILRGIARGFRAPHRTALIDAGDRRILDDSYNASPDSMTAALALLDELGGRRVAVLGEMRELGDASPEAHLAVGGVAARHADVLVVVGEEAAGIAQGARDAGMPPDRIVEAPDRDAARDWLLARSRPGDTILVKASRGPALDVLVEELAAAFAGPAARV
jgi:UDP-N-acetylmuramoyl-tripeptide--D-alanyl-D-alanine ligase